MLNFLTTGAPADVAPQALWPMVDLRRLNAEGMLFDFVNIAVIRARGVVDGSALADDFEPRRIRHAMYFVSTCWAF